MGNASEFQAAIRLSLISTTVTWILGHLLAIIAHVGPPTYPAPKKKFWKKIVSTSYVRFYIPMQQMRNIGLLDWEVELAVSPDSLPKLNFYQ
jgi:hypothetical protein